MKTREIRVKVKTKKDGYSQIRVYNGKTLFWTIRVAGGWWSTEIASAIDILVKAAHEQGGRND